MSLKKLLIIAGITMIALALLAACSPSAPTAAPTEETAAEPTAIPPTPEPTAVPPTPTVDPAEAIKPIFAASGHADASAEAFVHWDAATPPEIPVACAKCHSSAGFQDFIADGKVDAAVPAPGKPFECQTCHNDVADKLTSVTFPSGAVIENLGPEARCMTCHQGRESKVSVDAALAKFGENLDPDAVPAPYKDDQGKDVTLGFRNIHYYAAAATLYGSQAKGGYEYDGKSYDIKHAHVDTANSCVGCHDQHSLELRLDACATCHGEEAKDAEGLKNIREPSSSKDYDGDGNVEEGVYYEIEGLQAILYDSIKVYAKEVNGNGIVYDPATYPYWLMDADGDGVADQADGKTVSYNTWTPRLLKAAYNYQTSVKDPGAFAHGGKYIIELLYDSIEDLNASPKVKTKFDVTLLTRTDAGHFDGSAPAWRHWDLDDEGKPLYMVEAACVRCHSSSALPQILAGKTTEEIGEQPAGNGLMCTTCHDAANWPNRYAVKEVTLPSTKVVTFGEGSDSNLCMMCHQGRASKKSVDDRIAQFNAAGEPDKVVEPIKDANGNDVKFGFINAHYLGIANVWFGGEASGAYEYDGKTYVGKNPHVPVDNKQGCVGCHDVHTGEVKLAQCQTCHAGITDTAEIRGASDTTDWNGNGNVTESIHDEYVSMADALYAAIQAYAKKTVGTAILYNGAAYPYWFADNNGNGKVDEGEKAYTTWTPRLLKAAFNYNFLIKNPGASAHNPKYVLQIIYDTIEDLGGDVGKFTRP